MMISGILSAEMYSYAAMSDKGAGMPSFNGAMYEAYETYRIIINKMHRLFTAFLP